MDKKDISQYAVFAVLLLIAVLVLYFLLAPFFSGDSKDSVLVPIINPEDIVYTPAHYRTLADGYFNGYEKPTTFIFLTQEEFQKNWNYVYSSIKNAPMIPSVNFDNNYVLAVYSGINEWPPEKKYAFHTIEVADVADTNFATREIYITYHFLPEKCSLSKKTQLYKPFTVIELEKSDPELKHIFKYTHTLEQCR